MDILYVPAKLRWYYYLFEKGAKAYYVCAPPYVTFPPVFR